MKPTSAVKIDFRIRRIKTTVRWTAQSFNADAKKWDVCFCGSANGPGINRQKINNIKVLASSLLIVDR
jgi:hypothetical protein